MEMAEAATTGNIYRSLIMIIGYLKQVAPLLPLPMNDVITHIGPTIAEQKKEEDITKRVNSAVPVFTTPMGIRYPDDSAGTAFSFRDAIVEYRPNIGMKSPTPRERTRYME